jgi:hypothetical protein
MPIAWSRFEFRSGSGSSSQGTSEELVAGVCPARSRSFRYRSWSDRASTSTRPDNAISGVQVAGAAGSAPSKNSHHPNAGSSIFNSIRAEREIDVGIRKINRIQL